MKKLLYLLIALVSFNTADAQITKEVKKFFKYSTIYGVVGESQPYTNPNKTYFVTQENMVQDVTPEQLANYSYGFGIRKVARFDYENKPAQFYNGTEMQVGLNSNIGAVNGWEYKFQWEKARIFGVEFKREDMFLRYLGKNYIVKLESYNNGLADLEYKSVDVRWRKAIGKKLNLSVGVAYRTHRPYGYLPIRDYLDDPDQNWWNLANEYGYTDNMYGIDNDLDGDTDAYDWFWTNGDGERVSDSDLDFRTNVFGGIVNDYNRERIALISDLGTISPVIGLDFYHYKKDNWVHAWASVMPLHKQVQGDERYSFGPYATQGQGTQWTDISLGAVTGWKITKRFGIFAEMNYIRYWDREVLAAKAGLNYQFR